MPSRGYKWWNFAYPTMVDSGANAVSDFVSATDGTASFGGTAGAIIPWGVSYVIWGDPANATGWSAAKSILEPTPLPVGTVASPPVAATNAETFTITAANGTNPVTVNAGTVSGSATLVYQVDMTRRCRDSEPHRPDDLRGSGELHHRHGDRHQGQGLGCAAGRW